MSIKTNLQTNLTFRLFFGAYCSGKDDNFTSLPLIYSVRVNANGSVWAESIADITMSTWCLNSNRNWPYETIECDIDMQLEHFADAILQPLNNSFHIVPRVGIDFVVYLLNISIQYDFSVCVRV